MSDYIQILGNLGVLIGIVLVIVELRQNRDDLALANAWAVTESSVAAWEPLADNAELAAIEGKVRRGDTLTEVEAIRYEAYVWIRLEQVWSLYDLHNDGVISDELWANGYGPSRDRASRDSVFASIIEAGPMPPELKSILLGSPLTTGAGRPVPPA